MEKQNEIICLEDKILSLCEELKNTTSQIKKLSIKQEITKHKRTITTIKKSI